MGGGALKVWIRQWPRAEERERRVRLVTAWLKRRITRRSEATIRDDGQRSRMGSRWSLILGILCFEDMARFPDKNVCWAVGNAKCTPSPVFCVVTQRPTKMKNHHSESKYTINVFHAKS